jgi:transposase
MAKPHQLGGHWVMPDAEWAMIEPYLPPPARCERTRTTALQDAVNVILYITRSGCQWSILPKEFAPSLTVQRCLYLCRDYSLWQTINHMLLVDYQVRDWARGAIPWT